MTGLPPSAPPLPLQSAWSPTWSESEYGNGSTYTHSFSSGAPAIPKVHVESVSSFSDQLAHETKAPNAYQLQRQVTEESIKSVKHKPDALNLAPQPQFHGFPEDPNRPLSQRPFSKNYPWPYDPSSYYNMARSPTVSRHAKPKAYPTRWEENGGLSRPLSMGGIDLPIPLSPMPSMPEIPETYREEVKKQGPVAPVGPGSRVLYDHERDGIDGQVVEDKKRRPRAAPVPLMVTPPESDKVAIPLATPAPDPYEYVPQPSNITALSALWDQTALGIIPPPINPSKVTPLEGVFVLKMYSNAPLYPPSLPGSFVPEHISFGPNATTPFYTLQAHPDALHPQPGLSDPSVQQSLANFNDLLILRRDPSTKIDSSVLTMGLNPHCTTPTKHTNQLGHDDLITLIYPKAAALAAISSSLDPVTGLLPPGANPQLTARAAVERAAETECCRLSFDPQRNRYYLFHPGIAPAGEVYLIIIDEGPTLVPPPPNYTPSPGTGFGIPEARGSVKLINVDTSEAVVVLDFKSGLLFINTVATRRVPSVYFIDVAVSTVLAVSVVEGRRKLESDRRTQHIERERLAQDGGEKYGPWAGTEVDNEPMAAPRKYNHEYREAKTGWGEKVIEAILAVVAFLVGVFWAVGAGCIGIFRGKKKQQREGDVEYAGK